MVSSVWIKSGLLAKEDSPFVHAAVTMLKNSLELVVDADQQLREVLDYPLEASIAQDEKAQPLLEDKFAEVLFSSMHNILEPFYLPRCEFLCDLRLYMIDVARSSHL